MYVTHIDTEKHMHTQHKAVKEVELINTLPLSQSYFKGSRNTPLTNKTIGAYFDFIVDKNPSSLAVVVNHQNIRLTYKEFQKEVNQLAMGLLAIGVKPGERVFVDNKIKVGTNGFIG